MGPETEKLVLALPRGRILANVMPLLRRAGIEPEAAFEDAKSRRLRFATNRGDVDVIRVRSFDVATFVAFGAAQLGIAGNDVLMEFDSPEIYAPLDLGVGRCRLSVAEPAEMAPGDDPARWSRLRIATKYPRTTRRHFARRGVQAECIKLSGAVELAPSLGVCRRIVDLVSTGQTLRANGADRARHLAARRQPGRLEDAVRRDSRLDRPLRGSRRCPCGLTPAIRGSRPRSPNS